MTPAQTVTDGAPLRLSSRSYQSPRATLAKARQVVSGQTGICVEVKPGRLEAPLSGLHAYTIHVEHVTDYAHQGIQRLRRRGPDAWTEMLQGNEGYRVSPSKDKAFVAAVGEALERYASAGMYDPTSLVQAPYEEVADRAMDPRAPQLYTEDEVQRAPGCEPYRPGAPFRWARATDLATGETVLVPAQYCWLQYNPLPGEPRLKSETGNGWAVHGTVEEAIMKGIDEILERDSFVVAWYNGLQMPRVDLDTVTHPQSRELLEIFDRLGATVHVLDTTTDLGYPTFTAVALHDDPAYAPLTLCFGAGLDPEQGILRALDECLGSYLVNSQRVRTGEPVPGRDEIETLLDHFRHYLDPDHVEEISWFWSSDEQVAVDEMPSRPCGVDVKEDIETAVELLDDHGIQLLALDTTPEDLRQAGFRSTKVFSPQICQLEFTRGLVGKDHDRLYEAPVQMGRLDVPRSPDDLTDAVHPHS